MFAKVEIGVTKQNRARFFAGKTRKTQFWPEFQLFRARSLVVRESRIGVTEFPKSTSEKEQSFKKWPEVLEQKPNKYCNFHLEFAFFWPRKSKLLGGSGYDFNTG